jgi:hypothetical protein
LDQTCKAVVRRQIQYGQQNNALGLQNLAITPPILAKCINIASVWRAGFAVSKGLH